MKNNLLFSSQSNFVLGSFFKSGKLKPWAWAGEPTLGLLLDCLWLFFCLGWCWRLCLGCCWCWRLGRCWGLGWCLSRSCCCCNSFLFLLFCLFLTLSLSITINIKSNKILFNFIISVYHISERSFQTSIRTISFSKVKLISELNFQTIKKGKDYNCSHNAMQHIWLLKYWECVHQETCFI